ncbi:vitamin B12 ABC transporter ATP-binding protein BtuD [Hafnia alvei]|uniref:Vitamin B12 import ATP-binding protein BtuD n=1 Tax=Hafnia alvei TaxID=569 RepID=A0A1C6YVE1_HAFAL|nr:vitamin B12 ABC transporter ATP-binding protein BtuD [Hafnia alvei]NLS55885.1 vitamin B12 ABC transporter ATP-binding protein BtuD [Hafnia alvei]SCM50803.1 vitamin B12 transport system ATP-binding protein [Hafnia alvei]
MVNQNRDFLPLNCLSLNNVSAGTRLLPFSAQVKRGALIHIIGPNGAGKSTLLSRIAGILPGEGAIMLNQIDIEKLTATELARYRAYLHQQQQPSAVMPVFQFLALHQPAGCDGELADGVVDYLAETLNLSDKLARPLTHLSGGEWQRVRIAAVCLQIWPTLNPQASLLLLDEPMNSLDISQQAAVDRLLKQLTQLGICVIVSAHDLNHTQRHAQQVWMLKAGVVSQQGAARDVMTVQNLSALFEIDFRELESEGQRWFVYTLHP